MKKSICLILFSIATVHSQSWQWGASGGGSGTRQYEDEYVKSIVTDSQKNVYFLSQLFSGGTQINGSPLPFYDSPGGEDYVIASFSCDGTLRWSKTIGGWDSETCTNLAIDAQDNIYFTGTFSPQQTPFLEYPRRIGTDLILTNASDKSNIFIAKYNNMGVMQWIKRPLNQDPNANILYGTYDPKLISVDPDGTVYCLVNFAPGVHCNGAFTTTAPVTSTGIPFYILKYDTNGNFLNGKTFDLKLNNDYGSHAQYFRNPNTGQFFVYSYRGNSPIGAGVVIAGETFSNSAFIACFNSEGQFLWKKENVDTTVDGGNMVTQNLVFDEQNNIYMSAIMDDTSGPQYNFMGYSPPNFAPQTILKLDPTGQNLLWATSPTSITGNTSEGGIAYRDGKLCLVNWGRRAGFSWGSQSVVAPVNTGGVAPMLAIFNAQTGACTGLSLMDSNSTDQGTAVAIDASGDIIMGGRFSGQLTIGSNILETIGDDDFFIAKYSTTACSPLAVNANEKIKNTLVAYPNPTSSTINICISESSNFNIYSSTGANVQKGIIDQENNTIDISKLAIGAYTIVVITPAGLVSEVKVLKE